MGGISFWQLFIIAIVITILFGGRRLRNLGNDLGYSLKNFRKAIKEEDETKQETLENKKSS